MSVATACIYFKDLFRNPDREFHVRELYINRDEVSIAAALNAVNEQFKDTIILGSYPDFHNRCLL